MNKFIKGESKLEGPSHSENLTISDWMEILQNSKLTKERDLSIFQALYSFQEHKAYASQIVLIL